MSTIIERLEAAYDYLREQLSESSTVRGVVTLLALGGGALAKLPADTVLWAGLIVSSVLKIMLPDDLPWSKKKDKP